MKQERQRAPRSRHLLLLLLFLANFSSIRSQSSDHIKKFGDRCKFTEECGFDGAICDDITWQCLCVPEKPISNHLDKCGTPAKINESCTFNEQCEHVYYKTICRDGVCSCKHEEIAVTNADGSIECVARPPTSVGPQRYVDPTMIGILVAMFLMFITICIVLRMFSNARWQENRTIFNTPNPRLMNVSLLHDNKLLHHDRRGSKASHGTSRPASMTSIPHHSPNSQGSRRNSNGSNASGTSAKTGKNNGKSEHSPLAAAPMLESVAVEIQENKP